MIDKMRFVSLTGPLEMLDLAVSTYLTKYDIHLENALSEFQDNQSLRPILDPNPYQRPLGILTEIADYLGAEVIDAPEIDTATAMSFAQEAENALSSFRNELEVLDSELKSISDELAAIEPFSGLDAAIKDITGLKYVKYRFGRIGTEYSRKFEEVISSSNAIFLPSSKTREFVYGVYFVPISEAKYIDAQLFSLHFERFHISDEEEGSPAQICERIVKRKQEIEARKKEFTDGQRKKLASRAADIISAKDRLSLAASCYDIRKKAAATKGKDDNSFIICGWMPLHQADELSDDISANPELRIVVDDENGAKSKPPTRFHNLKLFKPFEMYTQMYGLPAYNEFDPTIFIGLTYSFIFGWMFGDVGQGLVLTILGLILYNVKHMKLAGIIACAGVFSTFFGFMFGSVFGFEDWIPAYWMRAGEAMTKLPMVGNLNTIFAVAIVFGMGMILVTMVLNIINSLRVKDYENGLFSQNGVAGMIFYGTVVASIILFMSDRPGLGSILLSVLIIVPVICMAFKEQLSHLITSKKEETHTGIGMFIATAFFELFEIMLSFFSNTLSFVRIGAFAVSHAAMMEVVLMLAGAESGNLNIAVVIFGNIFVMGMEGLVVGIQVLRLEYYEFFSRFYRGTGRAFVSFRDGLKTKASN